MSSFFEIGADLDEYDDEELEDLLGSDYLLEGDGGDDEEDYLVGADDLVGARFGRGRFSRGRGRARGRVKRRPSSRALQMRKAQAATIVKQSPPTRGRELVLGFDSVATIAAAGTLGITANPQVVFRPDRIVIPQSIAASFLINDIRIGKNSQLTATGGVPAETFSNQSFGVRLKMDTAQVSQDVVINVSNLSGGALRFMASMIGPSLEQ